MKLQDKIILANLSYSLIFLVVAGFIFYWVITYTVYDQLDKHLVGHKEDLLTQIAQGQVGLNDVLKLRPIGKSEWAELSPVDSSTFDDPIHRYQTVYRHLPEHKADSNKVRRFTSTARIDGQLYLLRIYEDISGWDTIIYTMISVVALTLLLWIGLMYLGNQYLFKRMLAPFYATVDKVSGIKGPESFETHFPESGTDEIDELNNALNRMLRQLKSTFEEQKEFLQNASHELLTPLSIIRQKAEKLISDPDLSEASTRRLIQIQETVARLSRLSNTLLMISKIENRQFPLDTKIRLDEVLKEVHSEMQDFADARQQKLQLDLEDKSVMEGNRDLLHALFFNIIQNAIKYSPEASVIKINGHQNAKSYHVTVEDQGEGIDPDFLPHIFNRFKKSHQAWDESPGLGLSIVKSICELHGIEYDIESEPGAGTTFILDFPVNGTAK